MGAEITKKYYCTDENNASCINKVRRLSVNRLIVPTDLILTRKNNIKSYSLVLPQEESDSYAKMDKDLLAHELRLIRADFSQISEQNMMFENLSPENVMIAGGKIYIYDYKKLIMSSDEEYARTFNNVKLNELFGHSLLVSEYPHKDRFNLFDKFYTQFLETNNDYFEDFLEKEVKEKTLERHFFKG